MAVEPVLQVNPCLANDIIRPHKIVVHHCDNQLCVQRERRCEFKHPERQRQTYRQSDRGSVREY